MSYIEDSLGRNETVHYIAHFHWINYVMAYGALILAAVISILIYNDNFPYIVILPIVVGLIIFLGIMVPIWTTQIGVTTQRVIYKRGLIRRETQEMQLRTVEGVSLDQDILGRILGYGRLVIEGTGNDKVDLPALGDPVALRRALQEAIGENQNAPPVGVIAESA